MKNTLTKQRKGSDHDSNAFFNFHGSGEPSFFGNSQFFPPIQGMFEGVAQKEAEPEEEAAQGKFDTVQKMEGEEEEAAQGKFDTVQKMEGEEEEAAQGKFDTVQKMEGEEEEAAQGKFDTTQMKCDSCDQDEAQQKEAGGDVAIQQKTETPSSQGSSMPAEVQGKMENSFGTSFSDVNIHAESVQAKEIGALAYTQGSDVHFAPGQFKPDTQSGQELLGHELTHVVQQREGRVEPTTEAKGMPVNDDHGLENEADVMGRKAAEGESVKE